MERFDCESISARPSRAPVSYRVDEAGVEVTLERASEREHDDEGEGV